ncbi:tetratricopeptide repeat protein [Pseudoxanthomonas sacheonensis]|uniref:tetratricopeptide repeat protein n=1 Tax=Pseudoxanthomonas sacheonensis TaxID=443615 RepID=UPI0013D28430|nr:tetratricopeptide repeat protein [Pseudoxanthomonas sacheonensis]KAF1711837.1 transglutaminase [Pseudoxanthomonas sacheonensis]
MIGWALAAALALSTPAVEHASLEHAPPDPAQLMAVPPALRALVQERVNAPGRSQSQRLRRLIGLMSTSQDGLRLEYQDDATQTVEQAYLNRQVNCLTYTLVFLALAREAGLDAYPQEIDETLSWQQRQDVVYRSNHVNAAVRLGAQRYVVDVGSSFVIGRHPAHVISEQRLLAQYYNNRAAQLMVLDDLPAALAHADISLELDPAYPTTWSNTGVLRLHSGDLAGAERAYATALSLAPEHSSALFNLVALYKRSGDHEREAQFQRRLDKVQSRDPFHQFMLAMQFEQRGDYAQAIKRYQRAIRLHGGEHRFYHGLARAYAQAGNSRSARRALQRAVALAAGKDEAALAQYRAMLHGLLAAGGS